MNSVINTVGTDISYADTGDMRGFVLLSGCTGLNIIASFMRILDHYDFEPQCGATQLFVRYLIP